MTTKSILVGMPTDLRADIDELNLLLGGGSLQFGVEPFDGDALIQLLVILTPSTSAVLIQWIRSKADRAKSCRLVRDGVEYTGYSAKEINDLLQSFIRADQNPGELDK